MGVRFLALSRGISGQPIRQKPCGRPHLWECTKKGQFGSNYWKPKLKLMAETGPKAREARGASKYLWKKAVMIMEGPPVGAATKINADEKAFYKQVRLKDAPISRIKKVLTSIINVPQA